MQTRNNITHHVDTALATEVATLTRMARWYAGDPEDAEDLLQDTCLLALRFGKQFKEGTNARAWLLKIMRNRHISIVRRRGLERRVFESEERHTLARRSIGESALRTLERDGGIEVGDDLSDPVVEALDELRPEFREAVWMCDVEGLTYAEAAQRIDRPLGTVMSRLHRGRRALRRKLGSRRELAAA